MAKNPPWQIRIAQKDLILAEFEVPSHKMEVAKLQHFLRALVIRYRTQTPEDMVPYYVNRRSGEPSQLPFANVCWRYFNSQQATGYWCGEWECYAWGIQKIDKSTAEALEMLIEQNRNAKT